MPPVKRASKVVRPDAAHQLGADPEVYVLLPGCRIWPLSLLPSGAPTPTHFVRLGDPAWRPIEELATRGPTPWSASTSALAGDEPLGEVAVEELVADQ